VNFVEQLGRRGQLSVEALGDYTRFVMSIWRGILRGMGAFARRQLFQQFFEVGTLSIPVVMITGGFIGAVLAIEAYPQFESIGLANHIGSVINISVVKQIGPVLTAVMLAGRVGGALTAELGTMKVTEQIDAMRVMAVNPIRALVAPRFLACLLMMPILIVFSDALGMLGGWIMSVKVMGVDNAAYWQFTAESLDNFTIFTGFFKGLFFGGAIASIACYKGFNCGSGAQGVGRACTDAFVASFVTILVMNFFIAILGNAVYEMLWPGTGSLF
jgi:phospholipid/cholesterol/gamma-HCH transport system permease protein